MVHDFNEKLIHKHQLSIGSFYFYKNHIISEIKEGIILSFENCSDLFERIHSYYGTTIPFVYISNRKNSYSFVPTGHFKSSKLFPNFTGYGVVTYDAINNKVATLEQSFLETSTGIFNSLDDALLWADELIAPLANTN
ncbi:hypothetical protein D1818_21795 [Aquimarina sp. BL5]|uniref:hypothetical protein n=1 Tax=Aquimarina sp. BL5 TaxID=1714860 RepID=UPI000E4777D0|nr:hypothetical protein [Aquimarina sp. BL5]AXT53330.1 hypothetical protein D1818_21795 [Aquimarina sp. BL5]RKN02747.1 hypothetical protein D7036_15890 [Aquimarina sp. BL5]